MRLRVSRQHSIPLICTALLALLWAITRACVQTITIDEADTYLAFVRQPWPVHWVAASNNHVLNTLLIKLFTSIFGPSHLALRAPALIGAAIYIYACYFLCRLMTAQMRVQWPLLVCLIYNPFVLDYLVAARGYSLSTAFLMCTLVITAASQWKAMTELEPPLIRPMVCASACAALSFAANFSFAFVDVSAVALMFLWACLNVTRSGSDHKRRRIAYARLLAASTLPALLISVFLSIPVALQMPKSQLHYGATSLRETVRSLIDGSLYELNPFLLNPFLLPLFEWLKSRLCLLLGVCFVCYLVFLLLRRSLERSAHTKWLIELGLVLTAILALTTFLHLTSFRYFHLLLPKDRTAMYFAPLCTVIVGAVAAVRVTSPAGNVLRRALVIMSFVVGSYFLLCSRLSYFKEWKFDADAKSLYSVLAYYNHNYGVTTIGTSWMFSSSLTFYSVVSGRESFPDFLGESRYPVDKQVYVLHYPEDDQFIKTNDLKIVYKGDLSDAVVAIRPELEMRRTELRDNR